MTVLQAVMAAAGLALIFGPALVAAVRSLAPAPPAGGFDRSRAVSVLLAMEEQMSAAGLSKASALTAALLVELVSPSPAVSDGKKAGK